MMNKPELPRGEIDIDQESIDRAMKRYNHLEQLVQHSLTDLKIVRDKRKKANYKEDVHGLGLALHGLLFEALRSLKPPGEEPEIPGKEWRVFTVLNANYVKEIDVDYIAARLVRSERTVKRYLIIACRRLANIFVKWEVEALAIQSARYKLAAIPDKPQYHQIVGRDELLQSIRAPLLQGGNDISIALHGGPGVGKTALAVELVRDGETGEYFQSRILSIRLLILAGILFDHKVYLSVPSVVQFLVYPYFCANSQH